MKTLYFDLLGGISGDMTVAALLDCGVPFAFLKSELAKLRVRGFVPKVTRVERGHLTALRFDVRLVSREVLSYRQIIRVIKKSSLRASVKERMFSVYSVLKKAEEAVHGHSHGDLHFHQLGEIDSIVDIAAVAIGLDRLGVSDIVYPVVPLSLKVSPAVSRMLDGRVVYFTDWPHENVTPTGMAILSALGRQLDGGRSDLFSYGACGYGAGDANPAGVTNVLRVVQVDGLFKREDGSGDIIVLEANIDDMNPQIFDYVSDRLYAAGARDVFLENVLMKKFRPGVLLNVLTDTLNFEKIARIILSETSTIGLRYYPVRRIALKRSVRRIDVDGHPVRLKTVLLPGGRKRSAPEYDDCRRAAARSGRTLQEVIDLAKRKM